VTVRSLWLALITCCLLAGCATPRRTDIPEWQGRISVQIQGEAPSSMSASFLLRGDINNGELDLYSPLGTTVAALQWSPQFVQLNDGSKIQFFSSLAALTEKTTGAALPIDAIFSWLQGRDARATGWQADLSDMPQGALTARRTTPTPEVTLRIKLDP